MEKNHKMLYQSMFIITLIQKKFNLHMRIKEKENMEQ